MKIILSFIHGASVWEGAAGIASNSDFPTQGNYILSNAFPKHTVVEITNLENGITIQAEVTGPLGTSGVLAAVSPEAAKNLSLRSGSVSRVRVRIPFTSAENLVFDNSFQNNDPDVNPQAAIAFDKARYGETEVSEDEEWLGYVPEQVFTDEMVAQEDSGEGTQGVGPEENIVPEEVITASEEAIENKKAMEMDSVAEETVIDDAVAESTGSDESSTEESGETEIEAAKGSSEIRDEKTESVEVVLIPPEEIETEDEDEIIVLSDDSLVPETPETSELPDAEKVADDVIISDEPELVVSFDDSQISWVIFDAESFYSSKIASSVLVGTRGRDYGFFVPDTHEIWISTKAIQMAQPKSTSLLKKSVLPNTVKQESDFLADVLLDEITHFQTGAN